jgi:RNA polymerase sigma-70 factor (ECF subfamily)
LELALIERCKDGEEKAYAELYELYKGYVFTTCVRYGIGDFEIKDMMQTIFIEAFRSLPKYDHKLASFKTWLTRIAINHILNNLRKRKLNFVEIKDEGSSTYNVEHVLLSDDMDLRFIHKVIALMPTSEALVFNLYIIDQLSHSEIAEKLNITENQSRFLLHKGRNWVKDKLRNHFDEFKTDSSDSTKALQR